MSEADQLFKNSYNTYLCPLVARYSNKDMGYIFSEHKKAIIWRKLWVYLAKAQQSLGIKISDEQIIEMESNIEKINLEEIRHEELLTKHEVMSHLRVFARMCPLASPIIHLGATSCYVTDNADLIIFKESLDILISKVLSTMKVMGEFCAKYKDLASLGYTHFQPAQLTTVGKRACVWLADMVTDINNLIFIKKNLRFRGAKGTVGTQASYLTLFNGDYQKVKQLDALLTKMAGFENSVYACGQTSSRKTDVDIVNCLASYGCTVHKICTDIRLLCGIQEFSEPFDSLTQIGSSAMPYKHNPLRSERCCGLARHLSSLSSSIMSTFSVQWLERSLDDSSNRRIVMPEAFLIANTLTDTLCFIFSGLNVYPVMIGRNIQRELPFLSVENILIQMVTRGSDRQECHERLRVIANESTQKIQQGSDSDCFIHAIKSDPYFARIHDNINEILNPQKYIGCASIQVEEFLNNVLYRLLLEHKDIVLHETNTVQI